MPLVTAETVKRVIHELYDYEIADQDAAVTANTAGAIITGSRHLLSLDLEAIEPPFGYGALQAEAARLAPKKKR
jgi:hypothetical protein